MGLVRAACVALFRSSAVTAMAQHKFIGKTLLFYGWKAQNWGADDAEAHFLSVFVENRPDFMLVQLASLLTS